MVTSGSREQSFGTFPSGHRIIFFPSGERPSNLRNAPLNFPPREVRRLERIFEAQGRRLGTLANGRREKLWPIRGLRSPENLAIRGHGPNARRQLQGVWFGSAGKALFVQQAPRLIGPIGIRVGMSHRWPTAGWTGCKGFPSVIDHRSRAS